MKYGHRTVVCKTHFKPKSWEIPFANNLVLCYQIFLKFCTEHGSITAVLCVKVQNDMMIEIIFIDEYISWNLSFGWASRIMRASGFARIWLLFGYMNIWVNSYGLFTYMYAPGLFHWNWLMIPLAPHSKHTCGPFYLHGLTLITACISNCIH